jgi:hypothetical protein
MKYLQKGFKQKYKVNDVPVERIDDVLVIAEV